MKLVFYPNTYESVEIFKIWSKHWEQYLCTLFLYSTNSSERHGKEVNNGSRRQGRKKDRLLVPSQIHLRNQ